MDTEKQNTLPPTSTAYGVDISDAFVAVVRARRVRGSVEFETLREGATEDPVATLGDVPQLLRAEAAIDKALLAMALPVANTSARWLKAPFPSLAKARRVLPSLLDIELPFPLESCVYGFPVLKQTDTGEVHALAVAARQETVQKRLTQAEEWHLSPHSLDHEGLALWDQHVAEFSDTPGIHVVCYLGRQRTVWIAGMDGHFMAAHATQTGLRELAAEDPDAPRTRQWRDRALRVARTALETSPEKEAHWYWTGPGAVGTETVTFLESALSSQLSLRFTRCKDPAPELARALAARLLDVSTLPWNFRVGDLTHPQIRARRQKALRRAAGTGLAAGLLLCALNVGFNSVLHARNRAADEALAEVARSVTGLSVVPRGQELMLAQRAQDEQMDQLAPFLRAFEPSHVVTLDRLLRTAAIHGLHYNRVSLQPDRLLIQGSAEDWDQCQALASHLQEAAWEVSLEREDAIDVEYVRFRIHARRDG